MPTATRAWAYVGAAVGAGVSIAANVLHSYVPPEAVALPWQPPPGSVIGAVFWPVALLIAIELFARWHPTRGTFKLLRWAGLVPVAVVAAVVSYRHMSGLLDHWHADPLTVLIGPLAVDGLMVMAAGCLIATSATIGRRPPPAVSLVKDQVARWARHRGLPEHLSLAAIIEHERIQARLAGTFDALAQVAAGARRQQPPPPDRVDVPPVTPASRPPREVRDVAPVRVPEAAPPSDPDPKRNGAPPRPALLAAIRLHRHRHPDHTQQQIADAVGVSKRTVARYWNAPEAMPIGTPTTMPTTMPTGNGTGPRHDP